MLGLLVNQLLSTLDYTHLLSLSALNERLSSQQKAREKPAYEKIRFCVEQARKSGIGHFWVDTCCIDKVNLVELSEAITSLYRWYREAVKCYAYISGVSYQQ